MGKVCQVNGPYHEAAGHVNGQDRKCHPNNYFNFFTTCWYIDAEI